ncbi:uncharacterized protein Gasu_65390 [Galdieria sulphuraria]|uniref:Uncharacterized protein n=1 Tax=Galdieria sulphuraria TaxID=130081 RepID=M2VRR8_GALSU|nr:uncharacterized protein Gasu_65390 [Galdieria sulphuraria]EME25801.1 hypothetical protein Gasu_65390 [Galdieria sulphuraria]|eukprot:XP_005702321.1 hypothetical protein Gasu_65390 [Galdieria sulphuraria]
MSLYKTYSQLFKIEQRIDNLCSYYINNGLYLMISQYDNLHHTLLQIQLDIFVFINSGYERLHINRLPIHCNSLFPTIFRLKLTKSLYLIRHVYRSLRNTNQSNSPQKLIETYFLYIIKESF